jgi:hypothetical protein
MTFCCLKLLLVLLVMGMMPSPSRGEHRHDCIHSELRSRSDKRPVHRVPVNYGNDRKRLLVGQTQVSPLRVYFDTRYINDERTCRYVGQTSTDYTGLPLKCEANDVLTTGKLKLLLENLMPRVHTYLTNSLAVVPVIGPLTLAISAEQGDAPECGNDVASGSVVVPPEYLFGAAGRPNTDLIVFVTTWPTSGTVRAFASACATDNAGRPVGGLINVSPGKLVETGNDINYATILHEMFHVVGFSAAAFPTYIDANGEPLTELGVIEKTKLKYGKTVYLAKPPRLLEAARAHFECDSVKGIELDEVDTNGIGFGNHWEKRLLGNELMTPTISERDFSVSELTLAMIESSGWYVVNYQQADPLLYGKATGCSFLEDKCNTWQQPGYRPCKHYLDPGSEECSFDMIRFGHCDTIRSSVCLEDFYQVFANDCEAGGAQRTADYCPLVSATFSCTNDTLMREGRPASMSPQSRGESFSQQSRCFHAGEGDKALTARCFSYRCSETELTVNVGNASVTCPRAGAVVPTSLGKIECPPYDSLCCPCVAGKGICVNGRCSCVRGARGKYCDQTIPLWENVVPSPAGPAIGTDIMGMVSDNPPLELRFSAPGFSTLTLSLVVAGSVYFLIIIGVIVFMVVRYRRKLASDMTVANSLYFNSSTPAAGAFGGTPLPARAYGAPPPDGPVIDLPPRAYGNTPPPGAVTFGMAPASLDSFVSAREQEPNDDLPLFAAVQNGGNSFGKNNNGTTLGGGSRRRGDAAPPTVDSATTAMAQVGGGSRRRGEQAPPVMNGAGTVNRNAGSTVNRTAAGGGTVSRGVAATSGSARRTAAAAAPRKVMGESQRQFYGKLPRAFSAEAQWDVTADADDELTLVKGSVVEVLDTSDADWWVCRHEGSIGNVPATFLKRLM